MADPHTPETRSKNMSAIKGKNTKPELLIRKKLHSAGFRYTLNNKYLPGKPDIVLPKFKAVIFVNGCFWHVHDCPAFHWPKSRAEWWEEKLSKNKQRDEKNIEILLASGWRVCIIWECALRGAYKQPIEAMIHNLAQWLKSDQAFSNFEGKHNS